jgi:3-hydroxymyristoyl/3-hydroxydecanoyl-(acyl carrier protein) dehydratase
MQHKFLDGITEISEKRICGYKVLSHLDEVFRDHFEGYPVLPAAMMVETASKLAEKWVFFMSKFSSVFVPLRFEKFKFYKHAQPGDKVIVSVFPSEGKSITPGMNLTFTVQALLQEDKLFEGHFAGGTYPMHDFMSYEQAEQDLISLGVKIV